jgi:hypothetical protein
MIFTFWSLIISLPLFINLYYLIYNKFIVLRETPLKTIKQKNVLALKDKVVTYKKDKAMLQSYNFLTIYTYLFRFLISCIKLLYCLIVFNGVCVETIKRNYYLITRSWFGFFFCFIVFYSQYH